jgi:hypothetical protein
VQSKIINYTSEITAAQQLAQTLGLPITSVVTITANVGVDIRVILGGDYVPPTSTIKTP